MRWRNIALGFWLFGFLTFFASFIFRRSRWWRLEKTATILTHPAYKSILCEWKSRFSVRRDIDLKVSSKIKTPFTIGLWRPVIILPALLVRYLEEKPISRKEGSDMPNGAVASSFGDNITDHISAIIGHEIAHIKHLDDFRIVLQNFIQALYFFHPAVWLTNHYIYITRECLCDSLVLAHDTLSRRRYARGLIASLKSTSWEPDSAIGRAAFGSPHKVVKLRILNIKKGQNMNIPISLKILLLSLAIFLLPMASQSKQTVTEVRQSSIQTTAEMITFVNPLERGSYKVSSTYGERKHPITGEIYFHRAVDLAAPKGTPVQAAAAGTATVVVADAKQGNNMGKYIEVQHQNGFKTRYTQLSDVAVEEGQMVTRGEKIGEVGSSGLSTGPHLHFEIWKDGEHVNPADYIDF